MGISVQGYKRPAGQIGKFAAMEINGSENVRPKNFNITR